MFFSLYILSKNNDIKEVLDINKRINDIYKKSCCPIYLLTSKIN